LSREPNRALRTHAPDFVALQRHEKAAIRSVNIQCEHRNVSSIPRIFLTGILRDQTGSCRMSMFRKIAIAGVATAALAAAAATPAEARWHGGWGWGAGAFAGGLALGALAARPYYYGGYYGGPAYGYYGGGYYGGGCYWRRRVVGYTPYGHPIVRPVQVCY
jgi:hypothetical protein